MNLLNYVEEVFSDSDLFHDIECEGTNEESKALEKICNMEINRERLEVAWSTIIGCLEERFQIEQIVDFFTEKTLNFLIDNHICLMDLCHLNLADKWLERIFETDNHCWEALCTLEERRKKRNAK